jgi:CheY-like chemotaxis protein
VAATPETRNIPIIVVTGSDANAIPAASIVLRKPFDPGELVAVIEQQLH